MKDIVCKLREDCEFKEPWRATDKSLTIVVPIVSKKKSVRDYLVLEEVKEKVSFVDTGGISQVRIQGSVKTPTFIRGGTMLKGATQERATQFGIVLVPESSDQIPVYCIHASRGIRGGATLSSGLMSPRDVYSDMLSERNQTSTWESVHRYYSRASHAARVSPSTSDDRSMFQTRVLPDDLVKAVETIDGFRKDLSEILKHVPDYTEQVGAVVVDPEGVLGLEVYDHPDSWKAFSESIIRSYGEALAREDKTGIFKPDMDAVLPLINDFLTRLDKVGEDKVFDKNNAKTFILKTEGYVGEYTSLKGKTIHLLLTRSNTPATSRSGARTPYAVMQTSSQSQLQRVADWGRRFKNRMSKTMQVLTALQDRPKTWTGIRSRSRMSKATLAGQLKELQKLGAVDKSKDENGVTRYSVTGIGIELLQEGQQKNLRSAQPPIFQMQVQQFSSIETGASTESCPQCNSMNISVWSFNQTDVNYECNVCRHKWIEPRKRKNMASSEDSKEGVSDRSIDRPNKED